MVALAIGITFLGGVAWAEAGTLYVTLSGTDSTTCGTKAEPCRNPDHAVKRAVAGDTIRLAGGTYRLPGPANLCSGLTTIRSVVCVVDKSLTIRGGYASSTWSFNPAANPTVLDGQDVNRGVHVFSSAPDMRLTIANVTIQNGRAQGPDAFGGGMNVDNSAVTLDNVTFLTNHVIGADTGTAVGGDAAGGALSVRSALGRTVSLLGNVRFDGNRSLAGHGTERGGYAFGALFVYGTTVNVENSSFTSNRAEGGGSTGSGQFGGPRADALGGAVAIGGDGIVSLSRVSATGNQVVGGAGTQYGGGGFGAAVFVEDSTAIITDSLFQSNLAQGGASGSGGMAVGGGLLLFNSDGTISRTRILANRAKGGNSSSPGQAAGSGGGGGLSLWRTNLAVTPPVIAVTNTVIADNLVERGQGVNAGGGGGGLAVQGVSANLKHLTLARNQLGPGLVAGQAILLITAPGLGGTNVNLSHSVIADHVASTPGAAALVVGSGNTLSVNRGSLSGNTKNTNVDDSPLPAGTITGLGSMAAFAPSFVAPGPPTYDYHITPDSPLRNRATGSTMRVDMDSQPRPEGGIPDLGADEYQAATCTPGGAGDTDRDGIPDVVEQGEGTLACAKDNNIFASVRLFVMQQYRDFLEREAETDGLLVWMGWIAGGFLSPAEASRGFFDSPEFQGSVEPIARLYFAYFDRIPDQAGLNLWISQLRAGVSLAAISEVFANSPEFQTTYGSLTNAEFVALLYHNVLGRDPDPSGSALWTGELNTGRMTRGQVMVGFSESPEFQQRSQKWVFVTLMYHGMLRRVPEPAGFDVWVAYLDSGASELDLVNEFLDAGEYRGRFLP